MDFYDGTEFSEYNRFAHAIILMELVYAHGDEVSWTDGIDWPVFVEN